MTSRVSISLVPARSTGTEVALRNLSRQLLLVRRRRDEIASLEEELAGRRRRVRDRLRSLGTDTAPRP
jgi:hypothetical protein